MKVLGLIGSHRRLGNTEILVKEALMGAEAEGAEVDAVRLTNYNIEACRGDAVCLFRKQRCHIQDDLNKLLDKIEAADGLILGTPIYMLESAAVIKQIIDRLLSVGYNAKVKGRPAAIIVPYANKGWTSLPFVQPNFLLLWLHMNVVHRELIHLQGLSEAGMDKSALTRANAAGRDVARAAKGLPVEYVGEPGICPICHDRNIRIHRDMKTVECCICGIRGTLRMNGDKIEVNFTEEDIKKNRFTPEYLFRHEAYHIKPSIDHFNMTKAPRKEGRKKFEEYLKGSLAPPASTGTGGRS